MSHPTHAQREHISRSRERRVRRELRRLLASVLLFGICFTGKQLFPSQSLQGCAFLRQIITADVDVQDAFAGLGSDLTQGSGVAQSVGSWCVSVFAPQEITVQTASEPAETMTTSQDPQTAEKLPERLLKGLTTLLKGLLTHDAAG